MSVSAAVMLPPTESPATAMRLGSSWLAAPSRTIHWAVAYPCSISPATSRSALGGRSREAAQVFAVDADFHAAAGLLAKGLEDRVRRPAVHLDPRGRVEC